MKELCDITIRKRHNPQFVASTSLLISTLALKSSDMGECSTVYFVARLIEWARSLSSTPLLAFCCVWEQSILQIRS